MMMKEIKKATKNNTDDAAQIDADLAQAIADITTIRSQARDAFMQREAEIDGLLTSLIAQEHVLLLGPPGTAKSALARAICDSVEGSNYFGWLMTKFSVPEEIFGPISLKALEDDKVRRITTNKLPEANIAFLDEIFKANSSILNALLTIVNEREFHNGNGKAMDVPLWSVVGASNELPESDDLSALFDRFLLRYSTSYLFDLEDQKTLFSRKRSNRRNAKAITHAISQEQLTMMQEAAYEVEIPESIIDAMLMIKKELEADGVFASDRRWKQAVHLIAAHAILEGRTVACEEDLMILEHTMWRDPSQIPMVSHKVGSVAAPMLSDARELLDAAKESFQALLTVEGTDAFPMATIDTRGVLKRSRRGIEALVKKAAEEGRTVPKIESMVRQIKNMQGEVKRRTDKDLD